MIRIKNIQPHFQDQLDKVINDLLASYDEDIDMSDVKGYVVDSNRGRAYFEGGQFTVPLWTLTKKPKGYFTYYTAHELSHKIKYKKYGIEGPGHNAQFYEIFTKLCPVNLQHHELHYKKSCKKYGIK